MEQIVLDFPLRPLCRFPDCSPSLTPTLVSAPFKVNGAFRFEPRREKKEQNHHPCPVSAPLAMRFCQEQLLPWRTEVENIWIALLEKPAHYGIIIQTKLSPFNYMYSHPEIVKR